MAALNYYPQQYYPSVQPTFVPQQMQIPAQQQNGDNLTWVRGVNEANAYPVAPGNSKRLYDSDAPVFYIKTVDISGTPMPLRIFDYAERTNPQVPAEIHPPVTEPQQVDYISRSEFQSFKDEILNAIKNNNRNQNQNSNMKKLSNQEVK